MKNALVISGGGIKGIKFLGALHYLHINHYLDDIDYYGGTSIGGILSFLICIGYTPIELITTICTKKLFRKKLVPDIFQMMSNNGAIDYHYFNEILENLIKDKIGVLPTLGKVKEMFGKDVMFTTYNYTDNKVEYISSENCPEINCSTAIRMSCNIPLIFNKFVYNHCEYIDGGVCDIFPVNFFSDDYKIIGIVISNQMLYEKDITIMHYIHNLFFIPIRETLKSVINSLDTEQHLIIHINDEKIQSWNFESSTPAILNMFSDGFEECKKNLTQKEE
jgi:NTE family protein